MYPTLLKFLRVKPIIRADLGASGGLHSRWNLLNGCCCFMRERGFVLLDLGNFLHHKWRSTKHLCGRTGLLVSADTLYVIREERTVERIQQSVDPLMTPAWACAALSAHQSSELIVRYLQPWVGAKGEIGSFAAKLVQEVTRASYRPSGRRLPGLGRLSRFFAKVANVVDPHFHAARRTSLGNGQRYMARLHDKLVDDAHA